MKNVIEIKDLKKVYPKFTLDIDKLSIPSGEVTGLIGENGAGKTTLIKLLLNVINKSSGSIKIFNKDLDKEELLIKEDIGVVLDDTFYPETFSPKDIDVVMKNIYSTWDKDYFYKLLDDFKITYTQNLKTMSKGMRKKVEIATALAHYPKLLILDEATSGLDPVVRNEILDIFLDFIKDEEHSILLSTHITSELEHIADHIIFINDGKIVLENTRDEILDNYGILKCSISDFDKVDKKDIVSFKKNKYNYEILVNNMSTCKKKYKNFVLDKITLEELMVLVIKGEK